MHSHSHLKIRGIVADLVVQIGDEGAGGGEGAAKGAAEGAVEGAQE